MKIATLTLNPAVDHTQYFNQEFRTGTRSLAAYQLTSAGGKGINVARIFRRLGVRAAAYGFSGGAVGRLLDELLAEEDIPTSFVPTSCETRMCVRLTDACGTQTEANGTGGPILDSEYAALKKRLLSFVRACEDEHEDGILFAGGSVPGGLEISVYRDLIEALYAECANGKCVSEKRFRVVLDADGDALREGLCASPWLARLNLAGMSRYVGYEITAKKERALAESAAKASRRIQAAYRTNVLCTMGAAGAVYTDADGSFYVNAPHVTQRGFVGAGDAFLASFVFAYEKNEHDVPTALCFASSAAAAKAALSGSAMPDKAAMLRFVEGVRTEKLDI